MDRTVWSVGHSTRTLEEFAAVLAPYEIATIADIRRFPGSRRLPHFHQEALRIGLGATGIGYHWIPELGGRRPTKDLDPEDAGWRHPSFRAYAAHRRSEEFAIGVETLLGLAAQERTAMMCAEVLWWRCHRRIVADVLVARGISVVHITSQTESRPHRLRPPARIIDGRLEYPADGG